MQDKRIDALIKCSIYSDAKYEMDWKGYHVYQPIFKKNMDGACIGYPIVILANKKEVRFSTVKESLEYLDFRYPDEK